MIDNTKMKTKIDPERGCIRQLYGAITTFRGLDPLAQDKWLMKCIYLSQKVEYISSFKP